MEEMMLAGMNVARLNFSHGTHESHAQQASRLRNISKRLNRPLSLLQDLQGPKIRVGRLKKPLPLSTGQKVRLLPETEAIEGDDTIPVDFPLFFSYVKPGRAILLDDGRLSLAILSVQEHMAEAEVIRGGKISSNKGINLPGIALEMPTFSSKDEQDLEFGLSLGVDFIAISFVRQPKDVEVVLGMIQKHAGEKAPLVIAKIERPEALQQLDAILKISDGVMVARGDLGVEMSPEDVPGAQKQIIQQANQMGKIVITATQMLETMIHEPLPTRAEASDVANAIYDGTDAVMLSGETAIGNNPVQVISMMDRIVRQAESNFTRWGHAHSFQREQLDDALAVCLAARELAHDRDVEAIAVFTRTGRTATLLSKVRPGVPILAFTPLEETYQRLGLSWGVSPHHVPWADSVEGMIDQVEKAMKEKGYIQAGKQIVLVSGYPIQEFSPPNMALLHTVR